MTERISLMKKSSQAIFYLFPVLLVQLLPRVQQRVSWQLVQVATWRLLPQLQMRLLLLLLRLLKQRQQKKPCAFSEQIPQWQMLNSVDSTHSSP